MYNTPLGFLPVTSRPIFLILLLVDLVLKGITLYRSARRGQTTWFIALLVVNSLGILPMIYLFVNKDVSLGGKPAPVKKSTKKAGY